MYTRKHTKRQHCSQGKIVNGGNGNLGGSKHPDAVPHNKKEKKVKHKINRHPAAKIKKLSKSGQYYAKKGGHSKSSARSKVEHAFAM